MFLAIKLNVLKSIYEFPIDVPSIYVVFALIIVVSISHLSPNSKNVCLFTVSIDRSSNSKHQLFDILLNNLHKYPDSGD